MYKVAIVQNESEMMRYGWADIRPTIQRFGYYFDAYTGENIDLMFDQIQQNRYDAVLITTNACNNARILMALREARDTTIKHLLDSGKGLFISYQAKMGREDSFGFLPEAYDVSLVSRSREKEVTTDANLRIVEEQARHPVVFFPHSVDTDKITQQCLNNNLVEGIYWAYIEPCVQGIYQPLIVDNLYTPVRNILMTSRTDLAARVVLSALVADWQGHDSLWENILRYVIEGRPSIAVVIREGSSSRSFRYLTSTVNIRKLSSTHYELRALDDLLALPITAHEVLLLDPNWTERDIFDLNEKQRLVTSPGFSRIFYFTKTPRGDVVLNTISSFKDFDRVASNALTWLISSYEDGGKPYWGGSFWTTVDVVSTLVTFKHPIKQYEEKLIEEIDKHDIDGSYDEVVGTTCGLLELYNWFVGREHPRYQRTLTWIKTHVETKTMYEQASAIDVLVRLGEELPERMLSNFRSEVMSSLNSLTNEFSLHRYIKSLLVCGLTKEAEQLALNLRPLQNISDGSWINIPNTAVIALTLVDLQNSTPRPNREIEEMIFRAMLFLKSTYSEELHSWDSDPLATAVALRALRAFETQITFPVDEILVSLEAVSRETRSLIAIEAATKMNVKLQNGYNELRSKLDAELLANRFAKWLSVFSSTFSLVFISVAIIFFGYLLKNDLLPKAEDLVEDFLSENLLIIVPTLAAIPIALWISLLKRYGMLPNWFKRTVARFVDIDD